MRYCVEQYGFIFIALLTDVILKMSYECRFFRPAMISVVEF